MSVTAPSFRTWTGGAPNCGDSIAYPYVNDPNTGWVIFQEPPLGMAAWKVEAVPNGYTLGYDAPIQMRLLMAPVPAGIQGQRLLWNGGWLTFTGAAGSGISVDVSGAGDVLFLPIQPTRDYTVQARQVAADGSGNLQYSDIVECTVTVGYDIANTAIDLAGVTYRVG